MNPRSVGMIALVLVLVASALAFGVDWDSEVAPVDWVSALASGGALIAALGLLWLYIGNAARTARSRAVLGPERRASRVLGLTVGP